MVVTGDADCPDCAEDIANFWYFREMPHLCMFSRRYAEFLCRHLALELEQCTQVCHYQWRLSDQIWQRTRRFAFRTFHADPPPPWAAVAACVPLVRRARNWTDRPPFTCSRDHVVATFQVQGAG
jgi:hypothetical protein